MAPVPSDNSDVIRAIIKPPDIRGSGKGEHQDIGRDTCEAEDTDAHMPTEGAPPAWAIAMMAGLGEVKRSMSNIGKQRPNN